MSKQQIKCKKCGELIDVDLSAPTVTCEECGAAFLIEQKTWGAPGKKQTAAVLKDDEINEDSVAAGVQQRTLSSKNIGDRMRESPYFTPGNSGSAFLFSFLFLLAIALIFGQALDKVGSDYTKYIITAVLNSVIFALVFLTMGKTAKAHKKLKILLRPKQKPNTKAYLLSVAAILFILGCAVMFNALFMSLISKTGYKTDSTLAGIDYLGSWWKIIIAFVVLGILPPILEEVIFRGIIYTGLRRYGPWVSIALTTVLFVFLHGGIHQIFYQAMLSIVLILALKRTGDLKLCMLMHITNNIAVLCLDLALKNVAFKLNTLFIVFACILLVVGVGLIFLYNFLLKKVSKGQELKEEPQLMVDDGKLMIIIAFFVGLAYYVQFVVTSFI